MKLTVIIILLASLYASSGQQEEREWKPKSFDSLDVRDLEVDSSEESINKIYTKGYFPHPVEGDFRIGVINSFDYNFSAAQSILPQGVKNIGESYSYGTYGVDNEQFYFKEKFSDEDESTYIEALQYRLGIDTKYNPNWSIPLIFRTTLSYSWSDDILFGKRKTKYYLNPIRGLTNYEEQSLLHLDEESIDFSQNLMIPFYGAFITGGINSYFYFLLGGNISYITSSEVNQFHHILTEKNDIRFNNGLDTTRIISGLELPNINRVRYGLEFGLGVVSDLGPISFGQEVRLYLPLNSIVTDEYWRMYRLGYNITILIRP